MDRIYVERLKFYADTPNEINKLFCWELQSITTLRATIWGFLDRGWHIRAGWYEKIDSVTGNVIEDSRINMNQERSEWVAYNEELRVKQANKYFR